MLENEAIIAKKYAVAFFNVYRDQYSFGEIRKLLDLKSFFANNNHFYVSLRIPNIPIKIKEKALDKIVEKFELAKSFKILMHKLIKDDRIDILDSVLLYIWRIYKKSNHIVNLKISSSHKLINQDKKIVIDFINKKLLKPFQPKTALTNFIINPFNIVGIRIESKTLLWERTIRKELLMVGKSIAKKGIPCG